MITALEEAISQNTKELSNANAEISKKDQHVADLEDELSCREQALSNAKDVIAEKDRTIDGLKDAITQQEAVIAEKEKALEQAISDIQRLQTATEEGGLAIADKDRHIHSYRQELYSVYTSKSWRYTLPIRKVGTVARRILSIPHRPWLRTKTKQVYFMLPALVRNSRLVENLKNRFKEKD